MDLTNAQLPVSSEATAAKLGQVAEAGEQYSRSF
jgi:hypothetical protein